MTEKTFLAETHSVQINFTLTDTDRTKGEWLQAKQKENRLDVSRKLFLMRVVRPGLAQVSQRGGGCPGPGSVQSQV